MGSAQLLQHQKAKLSVARRWSALLTALVMSAGLALLVETGVFTLRDVFGNLAETFLLGSSLITVFLLLFYAATGYSPASVRAQIEEVFEKLWESR